MPVRKCALCLQMRELCDSHVIPAGFYRILRVGATRGNDPVLVHKTTAFLSSDQARAHSRHAHTFFARTVRTGSIEGARTGR